MSIVLGNFTFTPPELLLGWSAPNAPGVYCICIQNPKWQPTPFEPIYFAQCENFSQTDFLSIDPVFAKWVYYAKSPFRLFIAAHLMPHSTPYQRRVVERLLINQYRPVCHHPDGVSDIPAPLYAEEQLSDEKRVA